MFSIVAEAANHRLLPLPKFKSNNEKHMFSLSLSLQFSWNKFDTPKARDERNRSYTPLQLLTTRWSASQKSKPKDGGKIAKLLESSEPLMQIQAVQVPGLQAGSSHPERLKLQIVHIWVDVRYVTSIYMKAA